MGCRVVDGFVPRDNLPLVFATLAGATNWMQNAARAIHGLQLIEALHANRTLAFGRIGIARQLYDNAIFDIRKNRTMRDAAMAACLHDLVIFHLGELLSVLNIFLGSLFLLWRAGSQTSSHREPRYGGSGESCALHEAATRHIRLGHSLPFHRAWLSKPANSAPFYDPSGLRYICGFHFAPIMMKTNATRRNVQSAANKTRGEAHVGLLTVKPTQNGLVFVSNATI